MTIEGQLETKTWSVVAGNIMEIISKIGSDEEKKINYPIRITTRQTHINHNNNFHH